MIWPGYMASGTRTHVTRNGLDTPSVFIKYEYTAFADIPRNQPPQPDYYWHTKTEIMALSLTSSFTLFNHSPILRDWQNAAIKYRIRVKQAELCFQQRYVQHKITLGRGRTAISPYPSSCCGYLDNFSPRCWHRLWSLHINIISIRGHILFPQSGNRLEAKQKKNEGLKTETQSDKTPPKLPFPT